MPNFHPLRCDIYRLRCSEFCQEARITSPIFRLVSSTVSFSCFVIAENRVYGEFSTLNLFEATHLTQWNVVLLKVRQKRSLVSSDLCRYYLYFGTSTNAQNFFTEISKYVYVRRQNGMPLLNRERNGRSKSKLEFICSVLDYQVMANDFTIAHAYQEDADPEEETPLLIKRKPLKLFIEDN